MNFLSEQFTNLLVLCLISIVMGCLIGLAIIRLIDHHLSNISINIPRPKIQENLYDLPPNAEDNYHTKSGDTNQFIPHQQI